MAEALHTTVDVSVVSDPEARRVLRAMQQEYLTALQHHRAEIDALMEVLIEKHQTSVGELRRHIAKAGGGRVSRLHEALWTAPTGATGAPTPAASNGPK